MFDVVVHRFLSSTTVDLEPGYELLDVVLAEEYDGVANVAIFIRDRRDVPFQPVEDFNFSILTPQSGY